jgi:putative ABC transport system permease protein
LERLLAHAAKIGDALLSILAITALGVGFYAGITATEPDMILSADRYYQAQNLADFSILSPLGFRPEDIEQIRQLPGIQTAEPRSFKDVFLADPDGRRLTVRLTGHDGTTP